MKKNSYKRDIENQADYLTKHLLHESKIFTNRVNLFFVAESLLFVSYFYTICIKECDECAIALIPYFGFIITLFYLFVLWRQYKNIGTLMEKLIEIDEDYREIVEGRVEGSANSILGIMLPFAFLILWFLFLSKEIVC